MDNVVGGLHVHAKAYSHGGKDDHREPRLLLKLVDELLPALRALAAGAGIAIDHRRLKAKALMDGMRKRPPNSPCVS